MDEHAFILQDMSWARCVIRLILKINVAVSIEIYTFFSMCKLKKPNAQMVECNDKHFE